MAEQAREMTREELIAELQRKTTVARNYEAKLIRIQEKLAGVMFSVQAAIAPSVPGPGVEAPVTDEAEKFGREANEPG